MDTIKSLKAENAMLRAALALRGGVTELPAGQVATVPGVAPLPSPNPADPAGLTGTDDSVGSVTAETHDGKLSTVMDHPAIVAEQDPLGVHGEPERGPVGYEKATADAVKKGAHRPKDSPAPMPTHKAPTATKKARKGR